MTARAVVWVGIDVGKASHHACAIDADGKIVFSGKVANEQSAIEQLVTRAGKAGGEVRWAIDVTSNAAALLVAVLVAAGEHVVYVPGRVVNRMAGAFRGESKTDAKDARVIAETARLRRDLAVVAASDDLIVELTRLTAHRADLMADWVRGVNRLRDLLTSIFPGAGARVRLLHPLGAGAADRLPDPGRRARQGPAGWPATCANTGPGARASRRWPPPRWPPPRPRPCVCPASTPPRS